MLPVAVKLINSHITVYTGTILWKTISPKYQKQYIFKWVFFFFDSVMPLLKFYP